MCLAISLALSLLALPDCAQEPNPPTQEESAAANLGQGRAVLITGASTGIGRRTAEIFAEHGFYVYAGARKDKDLAALDALDNVQGVRLDVTIDEDIAKAVQTVQEGGRGLHGLINNAGVAVVAPMIEVSEEDLDFQFDVNVYGPIRVTQAFVPLLMESKGRVSTTSSISGFLSWPFGGPYTMSKHAVEAYTEALASELQPFGVQVSVVEPGNFKSNIFVNLAERMKAQGYTTDGSLYQQGLDRILNRPLDRSGMQEPDAVALAFLHAMTSDTPRLRYMVVPNQGEANVTLQGTMNRLAQLNQGHEFSLTREELLSMLAQTLSPSAAPTPGSIQVLGVAQDGGRPQLGCSKNCCRGLSAQISHRVASLAVVGESDWVLIDATPDIAAQIQDIGTMPKAIVLTHAHIGHYLGLAQLGHEVMGADGVAVWCSERMAEFLRTQGPWSQLVDLGNIELHVFTPKEAFTPVAGVSMRALPVPHRDEFSDTHGFSIAHGPSRSLYIPDIDRWEDWAAFAQEAGAHDFALIDATFFDDQELPGRDMSQIPHPRVGDSMSRWEPYVKQGLQVYFLHLNHTNPLWDSQSPAYHEVQSRGYQVAHRGLRLPTKG